MKKILLYLFAFLTLWLLSIFLINIYVLSFSKTNITESISDIDDYEVWIIFWAKVEDNWKPSDILADRLFVWADAYNKQKIQKIIVTGDNSRVDYDEVTAMADYLVYLWVTRTDIYLDYAWFDTYSSLYRAREIFWVDNLVLFTQEFHLKRALYIWERLWIDVFWVSTNLQNYIYSDYYDRREVLARIKAFLEVEIFKSKPKYLGEKVDMSIPQEDLSELDVYN